MKHFSFCSSSVKRLAIVFILLFDSLLPQVHAQTTVTGYVIDATTGDSLMGSNVVVKGTRPGVATRGTNSDANGYFDQVRERAERSRPSRISAGSACCAFSPTTNWSATSKLGARRTRASPNCPTLDRRIAIIPFRSTKIS